MKRTIAALIVLAAAPAFSVEQELDQAVEATLRTGRVHRIGIASSERLSPEPALSPGDPPLLRFRYLDGRRKHRFGDLSLIMDDAGH